MARTRLIPELCDSGSFFDFLSVTQILKNPEISDVVTRQNYEHFFDLREYLSHLQDQPGMLSLDESLQALLADLNQTLSKYTPSKKKPKSKHKLYREMECTKRLVNRLLEHGLRREFWALEQANIFGYKTVISDARTREAEFAAVKKPLDRHKLLVKLQEKALADVLSGEATADFLVLEDEVEEIRRQYDPYHMEEERGFKQKEDRAKQYLRKIGKFVEYDLEKHPAQFRNIYKYSDDSRYPSLHGAGAGYCNPRNPELHQIEPQ